MSDTTATLHTLFTGLRERPSPQQVAASLVTLGADTWLPEADAATLRRLAAHGRLYTSMPDRYPTHPGLARAYTAAERALRVVTAAACRDMPMPADPTDPAPLARWVAGAWTLLGVTGDPQPARPATRKLREQTWGTYSYKSPSQPRGPRGDRLGHVDVRTRLTAEGRRALLPGVSVRAYRRAVAAVAHLEQRVGVLTAQRDREATVAAGKSRLAATIDEDAFTACPRTAAFVAYYCARLGMRTVFTSGSQDRPMDTLAEALLTAALDAPTCRPDVIARVLTRRSVLVRLTDEQLGDLLGTYFEQLATAARVLERAFDPNRDRVRMVVRRGDDSSSWNAASRAFNQARTGWLSLVDMLGLSDSLSGHLPGKVPALVAGDVAWWHESEGGSQHADVVAWAALPLPWDVVLHGAPCPVELVRAACIGAGLDAEKTGWTRPYRQQQLEVATVAPELVHGVAVASPLLAAVLRDAGVFSGQAPTGAQSRVFATLLGELTTDETADED